VTQTGDALRAQLLEAATLVGTAKSLIVEGSVVDLAGLSARIETVCSALPGLPAAEREELKPALVALMDGLGGLAEAVKAQHGALAGKLSAQSQADRARDAYGAAPKPPRR
jgi:hypothetical protein